MIVIVDYGTGNLQSVERAFRAVGADAVIASRPEELGAADGIVLPGVGAFARGMEELGRLGYLPVLKRKVLEERTPFLGICLGFQLLTRCSEEGGAMGLDWLDGETRRIPADPPGGPTRVPHIGWNDIRVRRSSTLLRGVEDDACFYFAHSYGVVCDDAVAVVADVEHGGTWAAVIEKGHMFGTQFHPEKSHASGLRVIRNFVEAGCT